MFFQTGVDSFNGNFESVFTELHILHRCSCVHLLYSTLNRRCTPTCRHAHKLTTSSITSTHAHSHKQTVKLTYSLSYLRLVNKRWEAVKAGKLSKPETTVCLMNWAASQHNISSSLGLKQTTQLLIGRAAWSRCEECMLPTSTVASQRLDRQQQDRLSVIESLHRYVTVWPSVGLDCVHPYSVTVWSCASFISTVIDIVVFFNSSSLSPFNILKLLVLTVWGERFFCAIFPKNHLSIKRSSQCCDTFLSRWQSLSFWRYTTLYVICFITVVAITADANYPALLLLLLLLFISDKQIKPITSCVPEAFAQESPTRHQVFRLANAKIHKLGLSWFILFANKHLFIWNVADISSSLFVYIPVCVISN